jgi:peptidoglycan/xylan/chitin deacetylase (PgdA/CDA1 family)
MLRRILIIATMAGAIAASLAHAATTAPPVLPSVSDPAGDAAQTADLTAFRVRQSGRGIAFTWRFAHAASLPGPGLQVCVLLAAKRLCATRDHLKGSGISVPARVRASGSELRVWARAAQLGIAPTHLVTARAQTRQLPCSDDLCTDETGPAGIVYAYAVGCRPQTAKYLSGSRQTRQIALTFDDGPGPDTAALLDTLHRRGVPATFYLNGMRIAGREKLLTRMRAEGHEIGNHSWAHEYRPTSSSISRTSSLITRVSHTRPCTFRPPYGAVDSALVARAGSLGMGTIIWDVDTRDWETPSTARITRLALGGRNGSVVLMHDGPSHRATTVAAVDAIITGYQQRGFELVTVDEMLGFTAR